MEWEEIKDSEVLAAEFWKVRPRFRKNFQKQNSALITMYLVVHRSSFSNPLYRVRAQEILRCLLAFIL